MKKIILLLACITSIAQTTNHDFTLLKRANRRINAKNVRVTTANLEQCHPLFAQPTNGDEQRYADKRASYGKALKQLENGLVDVNAFDEMVFALNCGTSDSFLNITMGTDPVERRLVDPQSGLAFSLEGADAWINSIPAAPTLTSAESAGEMVEVYWQAILRDVPFNEYSTDALATAAINDLNSLTDFKGPKIGGAVTAQTLFRGNTPGDLIGPYISQFLYLPVPIGPPNNYDGSIGTPGIDYQATTVPEPGIVNDFMTDIPTWKAIQQGNFPTDTTTYTPDRIFIRNGRDMAEFVHFDFPALSFTNAARMLNTFGSAALDPNNPYLINPTQAGFITYGFADVLALVQTAAEASLKAAWYQKWLVHRRLRPEFYGYLVDQQINGVLNSGINSQLINSPVLPMILGTFGSYLLPQAYPEGSPTHPSYPAGHAVFSGACATILKAFFNEDFVIPNPVMPNATNDMLIGYVGTPLTVGNELNKLAANITLGRDFAGVHYRSDGYQGMLLGEKIALSILEDESFTRNINFKGYHLTKFDGTKIIIGTKQCAPMLQ